MTIEIEKTIQANFPVIYVCTREEHRFILSMEAFCVRGCRKLWIYSISQGLFNIAFTRTNELWYTAQRRPHRDLKDPIALLEHMKQMRSNEGVFLLLDFDEMLNDPLVCRMLKDLAHQFVESHNNIIIVSPLLRIPPALEHEISVLDFPLPSKNELAGVLDKIFKTLKVRKIKVNITKRESERLVSAGQGMTLEQFEGCLAKAVVGCKGTFDGKIIDEIISGKKQIIRKSGVLEFFETNATMEQVGGLEKLKAWLSKRQLAFSQEAKDYGVPTPKGILLLGVQGCGKSLTAKACASLWKFPLLKLDTGALFSSQVGSSEERARMAIQLAVSISPCVLWIDEIEKAMAGVGSSSYSDAGTAARVFATIATWLQEKSSPVFVIATANTVTSIPPELIRKGRWDEIFFLDLPNLEERKTIAKIHLKKRNRDPSVFDTSLIASRCEGYSGAEIEQAVISGLYDGFDQKRPMVTGDILRNLKEQVPLSKTMSEHIQALRTWASTRARFASVNDMDEQQKRWRAGNVRRL